MHNKFLIKKLFFLCIFFYGGSVYSHIPEHLRSHLIDDFKGLQHATNFPSEVLFSIADIKCKTYPVKQSKSLRLTRSGIYSPTTEAAGSPMIQVTASTVIIDLNGQTLSKDPVSSVNCVGIEIGYNPQTLAEDTTLTIDSQPQNVVLRNGVLDGFEIPIFVHKGVKSVTLENIAISRSPIGIVFMGDTGTNEEVVSCSLENIKIVGDNEDESGVSGALAWAKSKVESSSDSCFNYGTNSFMSHTDPVDGEDLPGVYYGIVVRHSNNMKFHDVSVEKIGYNGSESNPTVTYGIDITSSKNLFLDEVVVSNNASQAEVVGCYIGSCNNVSIKNSACNHNQVAYVNRQAVDGSSYRRCVGLLLEDVNVGLLQGVVCNLNEADATADAGAENQSRSYGILWDGGTALEMNDVACNHNQAYDGFCYGMFFDALESVTVNRIIANYNQGLGGDTTLDDDATIGSHMGVTGICFASSVKSLIAKGIGASSNSGSSVVGIRIDQGQDISLSDVVANYNNGLNFVKGMTFAGVLYSCVLQNVLIGSNSSSGGLVSAITFRGVESLVVKDGLFNYNTTTDNDQNVMVLQFKEASNSVELESLQISNNIAHGVGVIKAIEMVDGQSVILQDVRSNNNRGGGDSVIVHFVNSIRSLDMKDVTVSNNQVDDVENDLTCVWIETGSNIGIKDLSINSNSVTGSGTLRGLVMDPNPSAVTLDGISISGNSSVSGGVSGFVMSNASGLTMTNCEISNNTQTGGANPSMIGLELSDSATSVTIDGLIISGVVAVGPSSSATGIYIKNGSSVMLKNIACDSVTAGGTAIGIHFDDSAFSITLDHVTTNYTQSTDGNASGMRFENCEGLLAQHISASQTISDSTGISRGIEFVDSTRSIDIIHGRFDSNTGGNVAGMYLENSENIDLKNISADQNNGSLSVHGIYFNAFATAVDMKDMSASNNSSDLVATGIQFDDVTSLSIDRGLVNNTVSYGADATGILFDASSNSVLLKNMSIDTTTTSGENCDAYGVCFNEDSVNCKLYNVSLNHTKSNHDNPGDVLAVSFYESARSIELVDVFMNAGSGNNIHGLYIEQGSNIYCKNCSADQNEGQADVYGMEFVSPVNSVDLIGCSTSGNSSSGGVMKGCLFDGAVAVSIDGFVSQYNQTSGNSSDVVGLEFLTSADSLVIKNGIFNNNISNDGHATGLLIDSGTSVTVDRILCNYNQSSSSSTARGAYFKTFLQSANIDNLSAEGNFNGEQSIGLHIQAPNSVEIEHVVASRNHGNSRAYGIFLDGQSTSGSNVSIINGDVNNNIATLAQIAMTSLDTSAGISKHLPVHPHDNNAGFTNVLEGGFGVYMYDIDSSYFINVEASKNTGMRAGGFAIIGCNDCTLEECKTSFQQASGDYFYASDAFDGLNTYIQIPDDQRDTIFGGTQDNYVDVVQLTKGTLHGTRNIKYLQDTNNFDPALASVYNNMAQISAGHVLLRAIIAQFRAFSTAVGVQIHNSVNCVLHDHIAIGNQSQHDNAVGVGVSGTAEGHLIIRAKCSGNEGWVSSKIDASGTMDISQTLPFWTFLGTHVLHIDNWSGEQLYGQTIESYSPPLTEPISGTISIDQIGLHSLYEIHEDDQPQVETPILFEPSIDADRLAITFVGSSDLTYPLGCLEEFCSVIGGMSVGILIGDGAVNIEVKDCDCANNKGNSGQAFGLMQDITTSLSAIGNRLYQSTVNDLGWCAGLSEYTLQSNSVQFSNIMFANTIGDMLNANFFIPFDPNNYPTIAFPLKRAYNGDISQLANALPYDNIEIQFIAPMQESAFIPNDMTSYWETDSEDTGTGTGKNPWTIDEIN